MLKILILEDEPTSRLIAEDFLKDIAQCDFAVTPDEALEMYKQSQNKGLYDVLLLDFELADKTGIEFLTELRQFEKTTSSARAIPVIMTTSHHSKKRQTLHNGADDFLTKPLDRQRLLKVIEKYTQ
jgi:CheY-like chemotaxis protein